MGTPYGNHGTIQMKSITALIILAVLIGGAIYLDNQDYNEDITFTNGVDTFTIDSNNLNDILSNERVPNGPLAICEIGSDKCMLINKEKTDEVNDVYSGPVPEGYDEDHFRETGETIKNK